jgi:hypothetical protein
MPATFYILLHVKRNSGLENYGRFNVGNDREAAYHLFDKLKGFTDIKESDMLCMELMETVDNLPVNIKMKSCSLQQLCENTGLITRHVFRQ